MISVIAEVVFAAFKKLYRFFGPALFLFLLLVLGLIIIPIVTDSNARTEALVSEANTVLSFEEVGYDQEHMDRIFRVVLRNNGADATTLGSLYITDKDGKSIYNYIETEYEDLRIDGKHTTISYIPPGSECVVYTRIDDYKLEGLDHVYVTDLYSDENVGKRFDIKVDNG